MVATTPPYEEKPTYEELLKRAERCLQGLSKSYVGDAQVFARWILTDGKEMIETLTATQRRCSDLVEELRNATAVHALGVDCGVVGGSATDNASDVTCSACLAKLG